MLFSALLVPEASLLPHTSFLDAQVRYEDGDEEELKPDKLLELMGKKSRKGGKGDKKKKAMDTAIMSK